MMWRRLRRGFGFLAWLQDQTAQAQVGGAVLKDTVADQRRLSVGRHPLFVKVVLLWLLVLAISMPLLSRLLTWLYDDYAQAIPMQYAVSSVLTFILVQWPGWYAKRQPEPVSARVDVDATYWRLRTTWGTLLIAWSAVNGIEPLPDGQWLLRFDGGKHAVRFEATEAEALKLQALIASFQEQWSQHGEVSNAALSSARLTGDEAAERGLSVAVREADE